MSCPRCGNKFAYVGLHVVECPNSSCDNHVRGETSGGIAGRSLQEAYEAEDIVFVGTAGMSHGRVVKEAPETLWDTNEVLLSAQGPCNLWCDTFNVGEDR